MYHDFSRWAIPMSANAEGWPTDSGTRWSTRCRRERSGRPYDGGAPVVADEVAALETEMVENRGDVDREERDRVRLDPGRLVARAVAALVVRDDLEPGIDERRDLLRPQPLRVGEPVHEHDRTPLPRDFHVEGDTTRVDLHSPPLDAPGRAHRLKGEREPRGALLARRLTLLRSPSADHAAPRHHERRTVRCAGRSGVRSGCEFSRERRRVRAHRRRCSTRALRLFLEPNCSRRPTMSAHFPHNQRGTSSAPRNPASRRSRPVRLRRATSATATAAGPTVVTRIAGTGATGRSSRDTCSTTAADAAGGARSASPVGMHSAVPITM